MILVFLGPPGSGKGTQAKLLVEKIKIPQIVAGDILREEASRETEMGRKIKEAINAGQLAPEEITIKLIENRLSKDDCQGGFILDGFPRSMTQAKALEVILKKTNKKLDKVVYFEVGEEVAVKRLLGRAAVEGRADDKEEVIRTRFEVYKKETQPLIEHYQKEKKLLKLDAGRTIVEVFESLLELVGPNVN